MPSAILIVYTTRYRKGGPLFPLVAKTLAEEKKAGGFPGEIICTAVESKREVLHQFDLLRSAGKTIEEFIFVGHSGMYGPMFGTVAFPEQFSPYEWETMKIPFAPGARAYFYCCRSARWFAPYFARTFNVNAFGFFWYTTFSRSKEKYRRARNGQQDGKLYTIGCKGKKSHGLFASLVKRIGFMPAEEMKMFEPKPANRNETTYNLVAELYDRAFDDIKVRKDEWNWLIRRFPEGKKLNVLDIGCGNGALLQSLRDRIESGAGVDESEAILERARIRNSASPHIRFEKISSPQLPFADGEFDIVISLMSFRYLDWDPLMSEVKRVSKPGALFLIIDMVTVPVKTSEYFRFLRDKTRTMRAERKNKTFHENLRKLVSNPDWKTMLKYNPIRSEHEMKWYLESRFPGQKMEILNLGWNARIVAFDSGAVEKGVEVKLSYP